MPLYFFYNMLIYNKSGINIIFSQILTIGGFINFGKTNQYKMSV